jgi:hypothetical protein
LQEPHRPRPKPSGNDHNDNPEPKLPPARSFVKLHKVIIHPTVQANQAWYTFNQALKLFDGVSLHSPSLIPKLVCTEHKSPILSRTAAEGSGTGMDSSIPLSISKITDP